MQNLSARLLSSAIFADVVQDAEQIVATELRQKNLAVRSVFSLLQRAKPDLLERTMRALLPDFARALDPYYKQFERGEELSFIAFADANKQRIVDSLLVVTDRRVAGVHNKVIGAGYSKLRARAGDEVGKALPRIAALIDRYAGGRENQTVTALA